MKPPTPAFRRKVAPETVEREDFPAITNARCVRWVASYRSDPGKSELGGKLHYTQTDTINIIPAEIIILIACSIEALDYGERSLKIP